jgi:N-acetylmuramoyl-L-alanine amidase
MKRFRVVFLVLLAVWAVAIPPVARAVSTVVVDAGHGGIDRGGMPGQKVPEKGYTLAVARRLASRLRDAGFKVVMTRDSDEFVGLRERCAIANSQSNAIFISVHFNGAPRTGATGVETYYYTGQSAPLAAAVHREVLRLMGTPDRHVRHRGFYVIRKTNCPAVLVEPGFLTNADEVRRLDSSAFQDRLAGALAKAIISKYR